ncbi:MAG: hypothetical protein WC301_05035 [Candidatus Omnitrophota bacterium]
MRLTYLNNTQVNNTGSSFFYIRGNLTVTYPDNMGVVWDVGTSQNINWSKKGNITSVDLSYSNDSGTTWNTIEAGIGTTNCTTNCTYLWNIDADRPLSYLQGLIRVSDSSPAGQFTNDTSNNPFTLRGALNITYPSDEGIVLTYDGASKATINWVKTGDIKYVNLSYCINGTTGPWVTFANVSASNLSYEWTIPDAVGNNVRINISDTQNPSVWDVSDNSFKIVGKLDLDQPTGGPLFTWEVASPQLIMWTPTGTLGYVKLEGSINNFTNESCDGCTFTINGSVPAGQSGVLQTYNYTVNDTISDSASIRVSDADAQRANYTWSKSPAFNIKGKIRVTQPNGGENLTAAQSYDIKWVPTGSLGNITIIFNQTGDERIIANANISSNDRTFTWSIPDDAVTDAGSIRIESANDSTVTDTSDDTFMIKGTIQLLTPAYNERVLANSTYYLNWSYNGTYPSNDKVTISYNINDGGFVQLTNAPDVSARSWGWYVNDTLTTNAKVKISRNADPSVNYTTPLPFRIVGSLDLLSPTAVSKWKVGTNEDIVWLRQGSIQNVTLAYSPDNGTTWPVTIAKTEGEALSYTWGIPTDGTVEVSTQAKVKIFDTNDFSVNDTAGPFTVLPKFVLNTPAANESVIASKVFNITWNSYGQANKVNLYYYTDVNGTWYRVGEENMTNYGYYNWLVNDTLNKTVQMRITYPDDEGGSYNVSPTFKIIPGFTVISPNGGEKWPVAQQRNIIWNCTSQYVPLVNVWYATDGGNYTNLISYNVSNEGAPHAQRVLPWTVANESTPLFRIRVEDVNNTGEYYDTSNANAWIVEYYKITTPLENDTFIVNQKTDITWDKAGRTANVRLDVARDDNFANNITIANSTPNDGIFENWTIPDLISNTVKVRVVDPGGYDINNTSAYFKIKGAFNVSSPSAGDRLPINHTTTVVWNTTGSIPKVNVIAYSIVDPNPNFPYNLTEPLVIRSNYENNPNAQTNCTWLVPDNTSTNIRVRIVDYNDSQIYADSGLFSINGTLAFTWPSGPQQAFDVGSNQTITWQRSGKNVTAANITYCLNGTEGPWVAVSEDWGVVNDGIVDNNGTFVWQVPDNIVNVFTVYMKIEDPNDNQTYDITNYPFKIRGNFTFIDPSGGERWVTNEQSHTMNWTTVGSVPAIKIELSKDNFTVNATNYTISSGSENNNSFIWTIPDLGASGLPHNVTLKISDANDPAVYKVSSPFVIDYYNITWIVRDWLTGINITDGKLSVNSSATNWTWIQSGLVSPVVDYKTPYGVNLLATWSHEDYGGSSKPYDSSRDTNVTVFLESKVVHVWEARTDYTYDAASDHLSFKSTLLRDGSVAGVKDESGNFSTIASNCTIEIYAPNGTLVKEMYTQDVSSSGFFAQEWGTPRNDGLNTSVVYNGITQIETDLGGKFRTPFMLNLVSTVSMYDVLQETANQTTLMIGENMTVAEAIAQGGLIGIMVTKMGNQTEIIESKMNQTVDIIENKTTDMKDAIDTALSNFENTVSTTIVQLKSGAEQAVEAGQQAADAAEALEATAKKFSWSASVSPDPAVVNQQVTLQVQGQPSTSPVITIYSWDNKPIVSNVVLAETNPGFYSYDFVIGSSFTAGKGYTYIMTEQTTQGLVAGSGTVEASQWVASVAPDPALVGEDITITVQGLEKLVPKITIYDWENEAIIDNERIMESSGKPGLYIYSFTADSRFDPGKSYTYVISEDRTGREVRGSGVVEAMSITTIAGLAASAPQAERAAKQAVEAIQALEALITTRQDQDIPAGLKNLQDKLNSLPETFGEGGTATLLAETVNDISDRLRKLAGEEGFDLQTLLEKNLAENPTLKDVRGKTENINSVVNLLLRLFESQFGGEDAPVVSVGLESGSVIFRIMVANPSKTKRQEVDIKYDLPQEVKPRDIIDSGILDLEYDAARSIYYAYRPRLELAPSEIRVFEIEVEDVWLIPERQLESLKKRTEDIVKRLENTDYYERGAKTADSIFKRLDEIAVTQKDDTVSRERHIGIYRTNLIILEEIKDDITALEKALATAGGPLAPDMLSKTKIKSESPTKTMTWILIFIVITFIGLLAAVLFFTWHHQARIVKEEFIAAKKSAFPEEAQKEAGEEPKETP